MNKKKEFIKQVNKMIEESPEILISTPEENGAWAIYMDKGVINMQDISTVPTAIILYIMRSISERITLNEERQTEDSERQILLLRLMKRIPGESDEKDYKELLELSQKAQKDYEKSKRALSEILDELIEKIKEVKKQGENFYDKTIEHEIQMQKLIKQ